MTKPASKPKRKVAPSRSAAPAPAAHPLNGGSRTSNNLVSTRRDTIPVVGLGGSAGSLSALQAFFGAMPADSGMAFVVVMHLSPEHESKLAEILQRETQMPVTQVQATAPVKANHVYVIPPGKALESIDGQIKLVEIKSERGRRVTVDQFFRTLGDVYGPYSSAVVLSGADSDGSIGLKRVKERGGLTIAQDPEEAQQAEMPRSAIATGMVDWVLPAGQMPLRLIRYRDLEGRLDLPPEEGPQPAAHPVRKSPEAREAALQDVLAYLRTRTGRDFSYYKRATIVRRLARRMQVTGVEDLPGYLTFLRSHANEAAALLQDLLISVTNFFRDPEAFAALEAHIPRLFEGKGPEGVVRVWTVACASGEEAFSVAMLLAEHARTLDEPPRIQVFATDLDTESIRVAREAFYPLTISTDVSEARLKAFFRREANGYRLQREIRETVLFAVHDALRDAPFSRLDLATCRNLLIYLDPAAQTRLLDVLHFALQPKGLLFLSVSETVDDIERFETIDKKHRLFAAQPGARIVLPLAGGVSEMRSLEPPIPAVPRPGAVGAGRNRPTPPGLRDHEKNTSRSELHLRLIERLAPPSVLVNADYEMLHLSSNAGRFLQYASGELSNNLMRAAHPMLRPQLRVALASAVETGVPTEAAAVSLVIEGQSRSVTICVVPAGDLYPDAMLVTFENRAPESAERTPATVHAAPEASVRQLESEIERLSTELANTSEQYDTTFEDLKASNEELQAMNEELRSASEELETSREELQSINEELRAVNSELKNNVEELAHANADLHNLMTATDIATLFLDRDLAVMRYTQPAVELFNLIAADIGRPITDITNHLDYPEMVADARRALAQRVNAEREVRSKDRAFLARVLPYRTPDDRVIGVVFTFFDISARRRAEEALRDSEQRLRMVVENAREYAIFSMDLQRKVTTWNTGAQRLLGFDEIEIIGQLGDRIYTEEDRAGEAPQRETATALAEGRAADERWHQRKDGSRFWGSGAMMLMRDEDGAPVGFVKILRDETAARLAGEALAVSRAELTRALQDAEGVRHDLELASRAKDHFLAVLSHELRTPLTPVLVAAQSLAMRTDLPQPARDAIEIIRRNVRTEAQLIDDLLDLTRIARGQLELLHEPVDLHEVIKSALDVCESDFAAKGQQLTVSLKATEHALIGDFRRLQQAIWNLLKNASKFTPPKGKVALSTRSDGGRFELKVTDTGIGIEPEQLARIFEPFVQEGAWVVREHGGLGLGLAISKATVDAHGGKMHAESDGRGRGSTVSIELPLSVENRQGE